MKSSTAIISAIIIGISFIIAGVIISSGFSESKKTATVSEVGKSVTSNVMTKKQLSAYLQLNEASIDKIIKDDDAKKTTFTSYDTYRFIPHLIIDNELRFLKGEIDEWLEYKSNNHVFTEE